MRICALAGKLHTPNAHVCDLRRPTELFAYACALHSSKSCCTCCRHALATRHKHHSARAKDASSTQYTCTATASPCTSQPIRSLLTHTPPGALANADWQVPKRLAILCCSDHNQLSPRQYSAIFGLGVFFCIASKADWHPSQHGSNRPASNLVKNVTEQLQQSGFLQQLPVLLSTAADQLAAVQDEQEMLASTQVSGGLHGPLVEVPSVALLQHYVMQLLSCFVQLLDLRCKLSLHTMHPAQHLMCAAVQHSCRCLELLPDQTAPSYQYMSVLACTTGSAFFLLNRLGRISETGPSLAASGRPDIAACYEPQAQHMYISQELMTCGCSLLLLALCKQHSRLQLKQRSDDTQGSSINWQYACAQHSRLPQPYLQLCHALGYSSRAFLYTACSSPMTYSRAELDGLIMDFEKLLRACHGMLYAEQGSQAPR